MSMYIFVNAGILIECFARAKSTNIQMAKRCALARLKEDNGSIDFGFVVNAKISTGKDRNLPIWYRRKLPSVWQY